MKRVELRHPAKFRWNWPNRCRDIAIYRLSRWRPPPSWILKFQIFNSRNGQQGRTAAVCQILSKSLEPRPRYVSFNIMLVWLENAYSRPFLGGFWGTFPQMMSLIILTPKRTVLGLNHVIWAINRENRSRGSSWACEREKKDMTGKKSQKGYISPICGEAFTEAMYMKICLVGDVLDVITCAKFHKEI